MPRLFMMRVYLSTSDLKDMPGYYSPFLREKECAGLIPIPDERVPRDRLPAHLDPCRAVEPCTGLKYKMLQPLEWNWVLHRDPRLDLGFYTDPRFSKVHSGDIVLFVAGLAEYPTGFWGSKRWSIREIRRAFMDSVRQGRAGVYIVGGIIVEKVLSISRLEDGWKKALKIAPVLKYSPHYYHDNDYPTALIGKSFILQPPLPVSKPVPGKLVGPPSRVLIRLLGEEKAYAYARKNYRKSSGGVETESILDILEKEGARPRYNQ